jgi:protein gp37
LSANSNTTPSAYTVDFWRSCLQVTSACATCAEAGQLRSPGPLRVVGASAEALGYEAMAVKAGQNFRIFTNSMSEFWEDLRELDGPRRAALATMRETPHLTWMLLTRQPDAILGLLQRAHLQAQVEQSLRPSERGQHFIQWLLEWLGGEAPENIWLGTTLEVADFAGARIKGLLQVPAAMRFLSSNLCSPRTVLGDSAILYHSKARGTVRQWHGPAGLEQYYLETLAIHGG